MTWKKSLQETIMLKNETIVKMEIGNKELVPIGGLIMVKRSGV